MSLGPSNLITEYGHAIMVEREESDRALMAAARAIDAEDEAALDTERLRIILADARVEYLERLQREAARAVWQREEARRGY